MPTTAAAAALGAALCWTMACLLWRSLPTSLPAIRLNVLKNLLALAMQLPLVLALWGMELPPARTMLLLALSGVVGIALGDSFWFAALRRLGTRRCLTVDAGGPAVTALAGVVLLGEMPSRQQWLGLTLISAAVLVVARQRPPAGSVAKGGGLAFALAGLLCGSGGALLARAALRSGALHPLQAATLRLGAAAVVMLPLLKGMPAPGRRPRSARSRWPRMVLATLLGTSLGIVLQQTALAGLPGGLAVALLSTAPVMALPLAWLEGDQPGGLGVLAAVLTLVGISLVVGLPLGVPARG